MSEHAFTILQRSLYLTICSACGVEFALPLSLRNERKQSGGNFFCPNGHSLVYSETMAKVLAVARKDRDEAIAARDKAEAALKQLTARQQRGVCTFCRRHFTNVERHMATKHPT